MQLKPDRTQVTDADTRVERMIRDHLASARPDDAILGEEFGGGDPHAPGRQWIVDPIDGTANFVRGVPIWGCLISLVDRRRAAGRRRERSGARTTLVGRDRPRRLGCRCMGKPRAASGSAPSTTSPTRPSATTASRAGTRPAAATSCSTLSRAVGRTRAFGDLWSYMLLAEGAIDIAGEFDMKPWDIAALVPIIREAGGTATTAEGDDRLDTGSIIATNGALHQVVLERVAVR